MSAFSYNDFIADMMRFASGVDSPEEIIHQLLAYMCEKSHSDRAYIFEDSFDGTYDNTYEYCRKGVIPQIDNMQKIPYEQGFGMWARDFGAHRNIIISSAEDLREENPPLYRMMKEQSIETLVAGPIVIDDKCVGFFGVDNPPLNVLIEISELLGVVNFVFDMMIRMRNYARDIEISSKTDPLTGCKNRKALEFAYDNEFGDATSICIIMCDLNGLKMRNDKCGHKAGDQFICNTADLLGECFGREYIYRLGGDEFVVLKLSESREDIERALSEFQRKCPEKDVCVSIGFEYRELPGVDFEQLLNGADAKMYEAKRGYYAHSGIDRRK